MIDEEIAFHVNPTRMQDNTYSNQQVLISIGRPSSSINLMPKQQDYYPKNLTQTFTKGQLAPIYEGSGKMTFDNDSYEAMHLGT
jgi:hypothetical protein